ncbi:MAG TPA: DNA polymerase Y family protein [Actinocrinis sp.]|nr:DNA polymerase Y family protein [Actinocrinis sp.]
MNNARPLRTLALWCPDWPVTAAGADLDAPVAILEGEGTRRIVTACSPAARENGVRRGQRVRDAQRVCPQLVVYRRDEAREAREFEPIAAAAEDLAAAIEVVRPGLVTLDARGPARYYGDEQRLADLVRDTVAELTTASGSPIGCGVGIADGPFAAVLAARRPAAENAVIVEPGGSSHFLAPYPVTVLDRPDLAGTLDRLGIRTLGAFAALPGPDVAGRFGVEGLLAHRLARGLDPRPPAPRRPADDLSAVHEFDPPAERDEPVAFTGKALADRLHSTLAAAGLACTRLGIDIVTASGRGCYRLWRHSDALGGRLSSLAVAERIRWQLDGWRTRESYPVTDPVVALRLIPDQLVVDRGSQQALWGSEEIPDRVNRAAERVQALLGHEGVQRPRFVGGRDPASQVSTIPWGDLPEPAPASGANSARGFSRGRSAATRTGGDLGNSSGAGSSTGTGPRSGDPAEGSQQPPWPGAVPPPDPPLLPTEPYPAELRTANNTPVGVTGRARLTGEPALLTILGEQLRITGWAGPWIYNESWWDPLAHRRRARLQCATADGRAWLLAVEKGKWRVEGIYG